MRTIYTIARPEYGPGGRVKKPRGRDALAMVLQPRAQLTQGDSMAKGKEGVGMGSGQASPFDDHKIADPQFVTWDHEGTAVVGIVRGVRETVGRNNRPAFFLDLAIGRDEQGNPKTISCSMPIILKQKLEAGQYKKGSCVRIVFTGSKRTGSGNSTKEFEVSVLPPTFDLKTLPPDTYGVKEGEVRDVMPSVSDDDGDDDLPF